MLLSERRHVPRSEPSMMSRFFRLLRARFRFYRAGPPVRGSRGCRNIQENQPITAEIGVLSANFSRCLPVRTGKPAAPPAIDRCARHHNGNGGREAWPAAVSRLPPRLASAGERGRGPRIGDIAGMQAAEKRSCRSDLILRDASLLGMKYNIINSLLLPEEAGPARHRLCSGAMTRPSRRASPIV